MTACSERFLCEDDFDAVLTIFRSYCYSANASETVEKIPADGKDYHKCPLCVKSVCVRSFSGPNFTAFGPKKISEYGHYAVSL